MDGRIGGEAKKPVPGSGVPADAAKLELSSKKNVKTCSDVTPELNRSSPPMTLPEKKRTVSSDDSSLCNASNSFDFRFVANDDEVRQLLVAQTTDAHRDVTLISHPDDLSQANLVSRLSISDDGHHVLRSGKLFEGPQPLTLVMDIRKLTSEELPKFNDLLDPDNPCLYDEVSQKKRPLGEHVALLVLADRAQLASVGQCDDAPGADFWRRINRPENTWQFDPQTGNNPSTEISEVPPVLVELPSAENASDEGHTVVIDCHLHSNWRQLLLGGPGMDKQGRIRHIPGRLETLSAGQRVILRGANWRDLAFEQAIRQMLAQKCYESNGKICQLSDNVQFYRMPAGKDELHSIFQSLSYSGKASGNPIIINQSNINQWLNPIAIAPEGYAAPNTRLLEHVRAGGVVTVTSPLTEALWFCLLGSMQTILKTTGLEPRLQVTQTKQQPKALGLAKNDVHSMRDHTVFNTVTYQQPAQASHWINHQEASLVIQVNELTSFSQLFDNIHITSEKKAYFGRRQSELQKALSSGKPVILRGLESNSALQELLEPLAVGQPLLVNGQLQAYPQAHVTLLWPESVKSPSSIFSSMVATAKPCPEVDIWEINAVKHDIPRTELPEQALRQLYAAFKTVPAHLCNRLPERTEGLLNNLILAARRAQQVDQSPQLLPSHWRKAINSVITHGTRQTSSVRDFMKVACWQFLPDTYKKPDENQTASVDPDRLNDIINSALRLDRAFVKQNLWPLARAFDPVVFKDTEFEALQLSYENPFSGETEKESLDRLCAMIVAHAPEHQREAMAYQLAVDPVAAKPYKRLAIRPSRQIKRLQDALTSGWPLHVPPGKTRSDAIQALATDCFHIARGEYVTENSEVERIERIENRLSQSLTRHGSADQPLSALARDLYHGSINQRDRESRRLSRLHDRLVDSPVIFLQGETGTGKSYFSAKMARVSGQASVISLGPSDSEQTLMKRWQWQEHADGDRFMEQQNRALMEWANTQSDKDEEYITLVLDEANLTQTGLLASLNGLWEPKPCIYVSGHPVKVSSKHRVILTGNPDDYAGRQLDPTLKEKLPRAYYPRLDRAFLRDRVVEPALIKQLQRHLPDRHVNKIAKSATESVMTLWQYYQELLPEHEFTPRDLTDICSWVGWYLDCATPINDNVTHRQMNGLIQQSFRDVLAPEISETHQDALSALNIWFAARYKPDKTLGNKVHNQTLLDIEQTFRTFTEQTRPDFDTSGSAVHELVQRLGQDLSRCQQAYHFNRKHDGRQATLIEGPGGRGKDATLNLVIQSVKQQTEQRGESMPEVSLLNACDCSWDRLCEKIQRAKLQGGIVIISEMNLIDSQHLEGELNDILAGDAHPGFHLFATINPPQYSGRKPLSPALKGRFRHLPIRQYSPSELQAIARKVLPETQQGKIIAEQLTMQHCRLRAYLQQQNLPLQPTSLDLQNVARAVIRGGDFTEEGLQQCLNQHYRLYLMAARKSLEELPESSALTVNNGGLDSGLCHWFNQTVSGIDRPWLIRRGDFNSLDEKRHKICIKADLNEEEARTEIIKRLAQGRWQASGLSLKPDQSDNILTQALYRHWQQCWFDREFGPMGVDANSVFPLTKEQEQTLKLTASQPYLQKADQRIEAWNACDVQLWPAFWHQICHQISALENHRVDSDINKGSAAGGDNAPEPYDPEVHEKEAPALDQSTDYECREKPQLNDYKIFDTQDFSSHMYRWRAKDIYVSAGGDIKQIDLNDKNIDGVETLIPAVLPGQDQPVPLASDQTLATFSWSSNNGQYALPSLRPNDYIVALRIEPDVPFTLIRNQYTGLHTLLIKEVRDNQRIHVAYVVEPREPVKKTPAKEARPEGSKHFDNRCSEGMKTVLYKLFKTFDHDDQHSPEVKMLLQTIKQPESMEQRIKAITEYCKHFSGGTQPGGNKNFFEFLVTKRQGSCRHRVPVFIAFCRYFGIPSREIDNAIHSFAEYSPDGGQTWESVDLGGAPFEKTKITSNFRSTRKVAGSSSESKKIKALLKALLKGADLAEQQTLAKACGMSLEELNKTLEKNSALPETNLSISEMVRNLWKENNLTSFHMGTSIIEALGTKALTDLKIDFEQMSLAVNQILSDGDEYQVIELLKSLRSKINDQAEANADKWLLSTVDILQDIDLAKPSVIRFALNAMELGWLDPVQNFQSQMMGFDKHHQLLVRLEGVCELKVKAADCLKNCYTKVFSREKNNYVWKLASRNFQKTKGSSILVTHCHDGFSQFFEDKIVNRSLQTTWTFDPEGIPNIERMLAHHPAFPKLVSGKANHRPVIILGQVSWDTTVINKKIDALLQINADYDPFLKHLLEKSFRASEQDLQLLNAEIDRYEQALQRAFCHYLYEVTHSKGGCLTYCWADANIRTTGYYFTNNYGARDPSSPEQLYDMMYLIDSPSWFQECVNGAYLRQAHNATNALVLKSDELTKIAEEFLNSVNLNSLYESFYA